MDFVSSMLAQREGRYVQPGYDKVTEAMASLGKADDRQLFSTFQVTKFPSELILLRGDDPFHIGHPAFQAAETMS